MTTLGKHWKMSDETKDKISNAHKGMKKPWAGKHFVGNPTRYWLGKKRPPFSQEWKDKLKKPAWNKGINGEVVICLVCGLEFKSPKSTKRKYCSRKCFYSQHKIEMSGENSPNYKGGGINNGYKRLSVNNRQYEHRKVMEDYLGIKLTTDNHIHHIDGNKLNNSIDNLMFFPTNSSHQKYHNNFK